MLVLFRVNLRHTVALSLALLFGSLAATADESIIPHRQDHVPNRPYSPAEAIERMTVPEGFRVELVAAEPDIVNPVAFTFDDQGRIWVTESIEYPRSSAGKGRDRIKILADTTGDGRADKVTVFADDLNIPSAIAVGYGGVWVMNAPDLLFFKEENGKALSRQTVVTGFGRTDTHELPSSLTWGPDGWLYGLNGVFNHCHIKSAGKEYKFNCALYRIHPRTHHFEVFCEGTSNPWGLVWDPLGSAIVSTCHWAKDHVFHFVETGYYQRQAGAYPPYTMKIGSISDHGHQKTAYCGLAYLDSAAYPEEYRDRLYIGNIHGGCINVDYLSRNGSTYLSREAPDFLTAHDAWFMPVSQKVGPDGCLYILDWYDKYHCSQDARRDPAGVDRGKGRLYRIRYKNSPRAAPFNLLKESDTALVERLASPNIFFRQRAQRILAERNHTDALSRLEELVIDGAQPRTARMHALWSIISAAPLRTEFHERLLTNVDPALRAWGVRAAGNMRAVSPAIRTRIESMVYDGAPDVQLQVAIAARKLASADPLPLLVNIAASCDHDKLIPHIVWPNLHPLLKSDGQRFVELFAHCDLRHAPGLRKITPRAFDRILDNGSESFPAAASLLAHTARQDAACAQACLAQVAGNLKAMPETQRAELRTALAPTLAGIQDDSTQPLLARTAQLIAAQLGLGSVSGSDVQSIWLDQQQPTPVRLQALDVLVAMKDDRLVTTLPSILANEDVDFLIHVLPELGRLDDPKIATVMLTHYQSAAPEVRPLIVDLLMQREPWTDRLLAQIKEGKLPRSTLDASHLRKIMATNDRLAIWFVEKTWGKLRADRNPAREQVVARTLDLLYNSEGDPRAGELVFRKTCAQCHKIHGEGYSVGPDLTGNGRGSFQQLVSNVLDPSLVIGPGYQTTLVMTDDGRNLTGIPVEDNDRQVVLRLPGGKTQAIPRNSIAFIKKHSLSMMPEGIEATLSEQELADLFSFLSFDKHPDAPGSSRIPGSPRYNEVP